MNIVSNITKNESSKLAVFAAGCFWGVEHMFLKHFQIPEQIIDVRVGYANGKSNITNPTYKQVCTGETDFAEAVLISYNPSKITYEQLTEFFFRIHDPTTVNAQGPDIGTQYRSGIYTTSEDDVKTAQSVFNKFSKWYAPSNVVTTIEPLKSFYDAETYHQRYLINNTNGYTCPTHYLRDAPK